MNIKTSSMVALLAGLAAPLVSQASDQTSSTPFEACIKAFADQRRMDLSLRKTLLTYGLDLPLVSYESTIEHALKELRL